MTLRRSQRRSQTPRITGSAASLAARLVIRGIASIAATSPSMPAAASHARAPEWITQSTAISARVPSLPSPSVPARRSSPFGRVRISSCRRSSGRASLRHMLNRCKTGEMPAGRRSVCSLYLIQLYHSQ